MIVFKKITPILLSVVLVLNTVYTSSPVSYADEGDTNTSIEDTVTKEVICRMVPYFKFYDFYWAEDPSSNNICFSQLASAYDSSINLGTSYISFYYMAYTTTYENGEVVSEKKKHVPVAKSDIEIKKVNTNSTTKAKDTDIKLTKSSKYTTSDGDILYALNALKEGKYKFKYTGSYPTSSEITYVDIEPFKLKVQSKKRLGFYNANKVNNPKTTKKHEKYEVTLKVGQTLNCYLKYTEGLKQSILPYSKVKKVLVYRTKTDKRGEVYIPGTTKPSGSEDYTVKKGKNSSVFKFKFKKKGTYAMQYKTFMNVWLEITVE